jgi:hypothetical protein
LLASEVFILPEVTPFDVFSQEKISLIFVVIWQVIITFWYCVIKMFLNLTEGYLHKRDVYSNLNMLGPGIELRPSAWQAAALTA